MKVSDEAVALWIRLLQLIPDTRLRIVDVPDHPRGDAVRRRFREAGLEERTEFLPTLYGDEYWNRFDDIDIALDPFPYTGATTTCDCLWMGVPVITLVGPCGAARSATSLLRSVGLGRLCAASIDEYIAAAMALARDRDGRTELRTSLPVRMARSSTCDPAAFTRDLEHLFQLAWDGWCEPPPARQKQAISPDGEYPRK